MKFNDNVHIIFNEELDVTVYINDDEIFLEEKDIKFILENYDLTEDELYDLINESIFSKFKRKPKTTEPSEFSSKLSKIADQYEKERDSKRTFRDKLPEIHGNKVTTSTENRPLPKVSTVQNAPINNDKKAISLPNVSTVKSSTVKTEKPKQKLMSPKEFINKGKIPMEVMGVAGALGLGYMGYRAYKKSKQEKKNREIYGENAYIDLIFNENGITVDTSNFDMLTEMYNTTEKELLNYVDMFINENQMDGLVMQINLGNILESSEFEDVFVDALYKDNNIILEENDLISIIRLSNYNLTRNDVIEKFSEITNEGFLFNAKKDNGKNNIAECQEKARQLAPKVKSMFGIALKTGLKNTPEENLNIGERAGKGATIITVSFQELRDDEDPKFKNLYEMANKEAESIAKNLNNNIEGFSIDCVVDAYCISFEITKNNN